MLRLATSLIARTGVFDLPPTEECAGISPEAFAAQAKVGQVYSCVSQDGMHAVALKIGAIDEHPNGTPIFHVQMQSVYPRDFPRLHHIPLSAESFARCVVDRDVEQTLETPFDDTSIAEGIAVWRDQNGGVFTVGAAEIYHHVMNVVSDGDEHGI